MVMMRTNTHKSVDGIYSDLLKEDVKNTIEEMRENGDVKSTVVIQPDNKVSLKNDFVILFLENFDNLITQLKLTTTELRVLIYILKKMEYGNLLSLNQKSVCVALDMKSSNVSNVFKKLKAKDVLVYDDEGNMYVNSNIVMKGLKHRLNKEKRENLKRARVQNELFTNSFN